MEEGFTPSNICSGRAKYSWVWTFNPSANSRTPLLFAIELDEHKTPWKHVFYTSSKNTWNMNNLYWWRLRLAVPYDIIRHPMGGSEKICPFTYPRNGNVNTQVIRTSLLGSFRHLWRDINLPNYNLRCLLFNFKHRWAGPVVSASVVWMMRWKR